MPTGSLDPINPIFTSYDRSSVTGLDYAINRSYHSLERFTRPDPVEMAAVDLANPQSLNLYSYVANDPINRTDPYGMQLIPPGPGAFSPYSTAFNQSGGLAYLSAMSQGGALNPAVLAYSAGLLASDFTAALAYAVPPVAVVASVLGVDYAVISQLPGTPGSIQAVLSNSGPGTQASYMAGVPPPPGSIQVTLTADVASQGSSPSGLIQAFDMEDGSSVVWIGDPNGGGTLRQTDSRGNQTTTVYDQNGNVVSPPDTVNVNATNNSSGAGATADQTGGTQDQTGGVAGGCPPRQTLSKIGL